MDFKLNRKIEQIAANIIPSIIGFTVLSVIWTVLIRARKKRRFQSNGSRSLKIVIVRGHHHDFKGLKTQPIHRRQIDFGVWFVAFGGLCTQGQCPTGNPRASPG